MSSRAIHDGAKDQDVVTKPDANMLYYVSKWGLMVMAGLLTCGMALAAAALSGHSGGWFTYCQHHFTYYLFQMLPKTKPPGDFTLTFWIGYVRGTSSLRKHMHRIAHMPAWRYLREGGMIGQVVGGGEAALLGVSLIASLVVLITLLVSFLRGTGRLQAGKLSWLGNGPNLCALWVFSAIFSGALGLLTILFYIIMAVGVADESVKELSVKTVIWPDWAWFFAIIVAVFWGIVAGVARRESLAAKRNAQAGTDLPFVTP